MTESSQTAIPTSRPCAPLRLSDLGLAPENLRFAEPEDADIPRLAETIAAAGLIYPLLVRKGRRGEAPYMVLDGRRRRFALLRLAAEGRIAADHPVDCVLAADRAAEAAAALLPNAEHAPAHLADVILAIGKLRRGRLSTAAIAEALGYDPLEVRRLEVLASVHVDVLTAFRAGKLSLRQVRLFARLKDPERQAELARQALTGWFHEGALQSAVLGGRVTPKDPRFALVSEEAYAAAGGRVAADLFGELDPEVLDPDVLDRCWRAEALRLAAPLAAAALDLTFGRDRSFAAPDGLQHLPLVHWGSLDGERRAAFEAARARLEAALEALGGAGAEGRESAMADLLVARLALARLSAGRAEVAAALLTPARDGLDATFYIRPPAVEPQAPRSDEPAGDGTADTGPGSAAVRATPDVAVEVEGVSHTLHAARTEVMTRGLAADLAQDEAAALLVLTAHLFAQVTACGHSAADTALRLSALPRSGDPQDPICGALWARLDAAGEACASTGARPLAFVAALDPDARRKLLADLVAACLDLTETRTDRVRREARAQGAEIAALCGADLARRWRPDAGFLGLHTGGHLTRLLAEMGAEPPRARTLRKADLVQVVAEAAAARNWIPAALRWPHLADAAVEHATCGSPSPAPAAA